MTHPKRTAVHRKNFYVDDELQQLLDKRLKQTDRTMSDFFRDLIRSGRISVSGRLQALESLQSALRAVRTGDLNHADRTIVRQIRLLGKRG